MVSDQHMKILYGAIIADEMHNDFIDTLMVRGINVDGSRNKIGAYLFLKVFLVGISKEFLRVTGT